MKFFARILLQFVICLLAFAGCSDNATSPGDENGDNGDNGNGTPTYGFNIYRYGTEFQGIWMFSATEWIAVGDEGAILYFDDGNVYAMASGVRNDLNDIWAAGPNCIFAVGDGYWSSQGVILHYNGISWSAMFHPAREDITGVYGFSATNVYAVTSDGCVIHYDGSSWTEVYQRPSPGGLYDVWCTGITNVTAVGHNGGIVRWDGGSWSDDSVMGDDFTSVWGSAYNNIYACGGEQIWRYDGSWGPVHTQAGAEFEEIHGSGANDVWAVGPGELVFHWNGADWSASSAGSGQNDFHAVWGWATGNAIALSDHGGVYQYDGASWIEINNSNQGGWNGIHGISTDLIYAVSGAYLRKWDGSEWLAEQSISAYNVAVWATAEEQVWTCSDLQYVYYYDGASWSQEYSIVGARPRDIWADGTGYVFVACDGGVVAVYDGASWSHSTVTMPAVDLHGVWGVSSTDVFVVGNNGTIYRLQGTTWNPMTSNVNPGIELSAVWGTSDTDVIAVGEASTIRRFDGTDWTPEKGGGVSTGLMAVWGDAPDNYWVLGSPGMVLHYDGSSWTRVPTGLPVEIGLDCVWGSGGNDVWIGGDNDYLLHYEQR